MLGQATPGKSTTRPGGPGERTAGGPGPPPGSRVDLRRRRCRGRRARAAWRPGRSGAAPAAAARPGWCAAARRRCGPRRAPRRWARRPHCRVVGSGCGTGSGRGRPRRPRYGAGRRTAPRGTSLGDPAGHSARHGGGGPAGGRADPEGDGPERCERGAVLHGSSLRHGCSVPRSQGRRTPPRQRVGVLRRGAPRAGGPDRLTRPALNGSWSLRILSTRAWSRRA